MAACSDSAARPADAAGDIGAIDAQIDASFDSGVRDARVRDVVTTDTDRPPIRDAAARDGRVPCEDTLSLHFLALGPDETASRGDVHAAAVNADSLIVAWREMSGWQVARVSDAASGAIADQTVLPSAVVAALSVADDRVLFVAGDGSRSAFDSGGVASLTPLSPPDDPAEWFVSRGCAGDAAVAVVMCSEPGQPRVALARFDSEGNATWTQSVELPLEVSLPCGIRPDLRFNPRVQACAVTESESVLVGQGQLTTEPLWIARWQSDGTAISPAAESLPSGNGRSSALLSVVGEQIYGFSWSVPESEGAQVVRSYRDTAGEMVLVNEVPLSTSFPAGVDRAAALAAPFGTFRVADGLLVVYATGNSPRTLMGIPFGEGDGLGAEVLLADLYCETAALSVTVGGRQYLPLSCLSGSSVALLEGCSE